MKRKKIKKIAYTCMIGDLFHYGHLQLLEYAARVADYHICGIITDEVAKQWQSPVVTNFQERRAVVQSLNCVDEVFEQNSLDPIENLQKIHRRYPHAKLIFFQGHQRWGHMPGADYVRVLGGEVIRPPYYPRLSRDTIAKAFINEVFKGNGLTESIPLPVRLGNVELFEEHFATKADTLQALHGRLERAKVEKMFVFTVRQWNAKKKVILEKIRNNFQKSTIVVRSSAQNEDSLSFSNAGYYDSVLNVSTEDVKTVQGAIEKVIRSYHKNENISLRDQILVQRQTKNVAVSGVVFTRNQGTNAPYYMVNYDDVSGQTDSVTAGREGHKIQILREIPLGRLPQKWKKLVSAIKEIEIKISDIVLDVEFGITQRGQVVIFQVRPLAANRGFVTLDDIQIVSSVKEFQKEFANLQHGKGLYSRVYLSDMAFWNPAEIIGDRPNYLDYSLYLNLILKTNWNEALVPLGYTAVNDALMVRIGSKPYINVHHAFLTLLPRTLPVPLKQKLMHFYNAKLRQHPELHDKIEFDMTHNCFHLSSCDSFCELQDSGFHHDEVTVLEKSLIRLTSAILTGYRQIVAVDSRLILQMEQRRTSVSKTAEKNKTWKFLLENAAMLLNDCRKLGISPFTRAARMAFIAKAVLLSLRDKGVIDTPIYEEFLSSIKTVATELDKAFSDLRKAKLQHDVFLRKYGHLRPGTYDIRSLPYHANPDYFEFNAVSLETNGSPAWQTVEKTDMRLMTLLARTMEPAWSKAPYGVSSRDFLQFAVTVIKLRELFKFEFTKNLSTALELVAQAGGMLGFSREEMARLDYNTLFLNTQGASIEEVKDLWRNLISARHLEKQRFDRIPMPPIVFSQDDFVCVESYTAAPNFITRGNISGDVFVLDETKHSTPSLAGKIVVLEKADPGYDWIFTHKIKGLITKYGGAASHMTIRCAEFQIPAVIGCGDVLFSRILRSRRLSIDCRNGKVDFLQ